MQKRLEEKHLVDLKELPVSNREKWLKLLSTYSTKEILNLLAEAWDFYHMEGYEVVVEEV